MKNSRYQWKWHGKYIYIIAFVIPVITYIVYMYMAGITPFGNGSMLIGDTILQLYPTVLELNRKIFSGDGLFFTWNTGIGSNFFVELLGLMLVPFQWPLIFVPEAFLETAMEIGYMTKVGLIAVVGTFYFMHSDPLKGKRTQKYWAMLFGISYALSGGVICYFHYYSWLDVYMLLPLLLFGLEEMIKKGHWKLYFVCLVLTIMTYYYLAYGVCLFVACWFLYQVDWQQFKKRFLQFAATSLLAVFSCGYVFLPVLDALGIKQMESKFAEAGLNVMAITNVWDFFNKLLPLSEVDMTGEKFNTFNVFCGTVSVLAIIYYLLFTKDKKCKRIKLSLFLIFMVMSQCSHLLIYIWHGFTLPHGIMNRFAFCLMFLMVYVAAKGIIEMLSAKPIHVLGVFTIWLIVFVGSIFKSIYISKAEVYVTAMLLTVFLFMLWFLFVRKSINKKVFIAIFVVLGILEVTATSTNALANGKVVDWRYSLDYDNMNRIVSELSDETGRIATTGYVVDNSGMHYNKKMPNKFSIYIPEGQNELFERLGLYMFGNGLVLCYRGSTPLTDLLLNVEKAIAVDTAYYSGQIEREDGDYYIIDTDATVGYGFMMDESLLNVKTDSINHFENQNAIAKCLGAKSDIFTLVTPSDVKFGETDKILVDNSQENVVEYCNTIINDAAGKYVELKDKKQLDEIGLKTVVENGSFELILTVPCDMKDAYLNVRDENMMYSAVLVNDEPLLSGLEENYNQTLHLGELKAGTEILIYMNNVAKYKATGEAYYYLADFNKDAFDEMKTVLANEALIVDTMDGHGVKGTVNASEDGILYTSIPDDGGFTVYVDGVETKYKTFTNALICVPVTKGEHTIEFVYHVPGLKMGVIISVVAWAIVIFAWNRKRRGVE